MKRDKLSLLVLAIEIAAIVLLHTAKSSQAINQKQLAGKNSLKQTELQVTSQAVFKALK